MLAWLAHAHTMVSHKWLSDRLNMGHPQNLSAYIKKAQNRPPAARLAAKVINK
jgi:hypothetical protein